MKKNLLILLLLLSATVKGQTVQTISTADTTKFRRTTGTTNSEVKIYNADRNVTNGIGYNAGSGWIRYATVGNGLSFSSNTFRVDTSIVQTVLNFFPKGDTRYGKLSNPLSQFASTTSSQLAGIISDETGSGSLVFATSPTLVTPNLGTPTTLVGTNITGTAAALNIGGNAATATLAANSTLWGGAAYGGPYLPLTAGLGSPLSGDLYITKANMRTVFTSSTGTNSAYSAWVNTSGTAYFGLDNSTGSDFGGTAYSLNILHSGNRSLQLGTNNTVRYTIDASGNNTWTGSGTFSTNINSGYAATITNAHASGYGVYIQANNNANPSLRIANASAVTTFNVNGDGALTGTSATFSGQLTSTLGNNQRLFQSATGTTGYQYFDIQNTSGRSQIILEGSSAGTTATSSLAYASLWGSATNTAAQIITNGAVRQTIDGSGNVGIGTTSPQTKLHISGTGSDSELLRLQSVDAVGDAYIGIYRNNGTSLKGTIGYSTSSTDILRITNNENADMEFRTNNTLALTIASNQAATFAADVTAGSFIKSGGTSSQFLKADGSVDGSTYVTGGPYLPVASPTFTGTLTGPNATFSGNIISSVLASGSSQMAVMSSTGVLTYTQGLFSNIQSATTTYNATVSDYTVLCDATSGAFTVNLPSTTSRTILVIKKTDSSGNGITIDPSGSNTIDGAATKTLTTQWESVTIQAFGSNWYIL